MEIKFRSFSHETKALFPMSLPSQNVALLPAEPEDLLRANWPDAHPGGARLTHEEELQIKIPFSATLSILPSFVHSTSNHGAPSLCQATGSNLAIQVSKAIRWPLFLL